MKNLFALALGVLILAGCANPQKEEIKKLQDEVIGLHDEMMPLMDNLYTARMKLQKAEGDSVAINNLIAEIKSAEDAMMDWMRNFNPVFEGETDQETLDYLKDQKVSMQSVADQMNGALKKSEAVLN